jgi:group I intron endonuclease
MYIVYLKINTVTQKSYVGITIESLKRRWDKHIADARRGSPTHLHRSIRKHGPEVWETKILKQGDDHEWGLKVEEPYYIALYATHNPKWGYNMTLGGDATHGHHHTPEHCLRQSVRQRGVKSYTRTPEQKKAHSEFMKGNKYALGIKHTQEQKDANSTRQLGTKRPFKPRPAQVGKIRGPYIKKKIQP